MTEFERIESAVRIVVGRPVSYLAFGTIVTCRWLYQGARKLVSKLRQRTVAASSPAR